MKLIAHPETETSLNELLKTQTKPRHIIYLVGPEGGFSPEEIKATEGLRFRKIRLPCPDILRVETAAVAMLAMLVFALD